MKELYYLNEIESLSNPFDANYIVGNVDTDGSELDEDAKALLQ